MRDRDPHSSAGPSQPGPSLAGATMRASRSLVLPAPGRLGTFAGVFTPVVLSILGVVMFMRAGTVVGHVGLWMALLILLLSTAITTFTTLSLSAIATNLDVRVGGVYFMVSRVLGPDFGGSIGITLYLALAVNVAFYTIGFTEAFFAIVAHVSPRAAQGAADLYIPQLLSTAVVVGLFMLTYRGTAQAIKAQNIVLAVLLLSVAAILVGGLIEFDSSTFADNRGTVFTSRVGFWTAFAIFFPAAAGISAGANMSGDLENPARSIPRGTIYAIAFTGVIYVLVLVLSAGASSRGELQSNAFDALQDMSLWGPLVVLGVFAASLSAALGSLLGAPRILQALGQDRLFKPLEPFGVGSGPGEEPRRATIATFVIALVVIWVADLDAVAQVVSMFFLIAYGMINTSAFVESKSANPSFRPRFRAFHWSLALIAAIGCLVAMVKIDEVYAVMALSISALVYFYLRNRDIKASWGDAKQGYVFARARDDLIYLGSAKPHPKNWRPIVAAVGPDPIHEPRLVQVGAWLESRRGLFTVAQIHETSEPWLVDRLRGREGRRADLRRHLGTLDVVGFSEVVEVDDYARGLTAFLQCYAVDGVRPNTVVISIPPRTDVVARQRLLDSEAILRAFDLNLVLLKPGELVLDKPTRIIDLWWRGDRNGSLMALLAYLVTLDQSWRSAKLRIFQAVADTAGEATAREHMRELLANARIDAESHVFVAQSHPHEFIPEISGTTADLVMLGLSAVDVDAFPEYLAAMEPMLERLPTTLLVRSNGQADLIV